MISFENEEQIKSASLMPDDIVQILGNLKVGDRVTMFGQCREQSYMTGNRVIQTVNGNKVEVFPAVTSGGGVDPSSLIAQLINGFHTDTPIQWRAGIVVSTVSAKYIYAGNLYVAKLAPFTTAATWEEDKGNWEHIREVQSVNGKLGDVVLRASDVNAYDVVQTDAALGLKADKTNTYVKSEIDSMFSRLFPVGHMLITTNSANPDTYGYPGRWELQADDCSLHTARSNAGTITGSNTLAVPLPAHSHNASFKGNMLPPHNHSGNVSTGGYSVEHHKWNNRYPIESWQRTTGSTSAGTPSGSVTVNSTGTSGATLDVRGKRISVYLWKRTA